MHSEAVTRSHKRLLAEMLGALFFLADERQRVRLDRVVGKGMHGAADALGSVSGGSEALEILGTWEGLQPKRLFVVTAFGGRSTPRDLCADVRRILSSCFGISEGGFMRMTVASCDLVSKFSFVKV